MNTTRVCVASCLLISLGLSAGCRQIIGIEPAEFDEQLLGGSGDAGVLAIDTTELDAAPAPAAAAEDPGTDEGSRPPVAPPDNAAPAPPPPDQQGPAGGQPPPGGQPTAEEPRPPPPPPPPPADVDPCIEYCQSMAANCFRQNTQYASEGICLETCRLFPEAEEVEEDTNPTGNTLLCRMRHADLASIDPNRNCSYAGPLGHDQCGSNCESFCDAVMVVCSADTALEGEYYGSRDECMQECEELPDLEWYSAASPEGMSQGNTVQCRMIQAANALVAPDLYCQEAVGGEECTGEYMRPLAPPPPGGGPPPPPGGGPPPLPQ